MIAARGRASTRLLIAAAALLAALAGASPASALVEKYWWGDYLFPNDTVYSTAHSWKTNRVWRPLYKDFALWFDVNGSQYYWQHNDLNNPFTLHAPSPIYSQAACQNRASETVEPVTCQTYDYNA